MSLDYRLKIRDYSGFTLVEIIITIGILGILGSLGLWVGFDSYSSSALRGERDELVSLLLRAENQAKNNIGGVAHGLHLENNKYVIFSGGVYNAADVNNQSFDSSIIVNHQPQNLDIVFQPLSGTSNYSGNIGLNIGNKNLVITINNLGQIDW